MHGHVTTCSLRRLSGAVLEPPILAFATMHPAIHISELLRREPGLPHRRTTSLEPVLRPSWAAEQLFHSTYFRFMSAT